jgi:type IV pilus assembly protein PilX
MSHARPQLTHDSAHGQRGAALIVALILLLVMTLLGITAMNSSILQGFMSASYQEQTVRLAAAENILLAGEFDVEDLVVNGVNGRDYYFNLKDDSTLRFDAAAAATWPNAFVIEYMNAFQIPGESISVGGSFEDSSIHIFRVSARSERDAASRGGLRIVQSLYVTLTGPDE